MDRAINPTNCAPTACAVIALVLALAGTAVASPLKDAEQALIRDDFATALQLLHPLADRGDARAEELLAGMYADGHGVPKDPSAAAAWYLKSAEAGDVYAQLSLGQIYLHGEGVPTQPAEAMKWYRKAADRGDENGQFEVGRMYFKGLGVARDVPQALVWERKVAARGGALANIAQLSIAGIYFSGDGVPRDYAEAFRWYRKAADTKDPSAQLRLAQMCEQGLGVAPDPVQAYRWYSTFIESARKHGESDFNRYVGFATQHREAVAARMTGAELAKAKRRASATRRFIDGQAAGNG